MDLLSFIFLIVLSYSQLLNSLLLNPNSSFAVVVNVLFTRPYLFSKEPSSKSAKAWNLLLSERKNSFCCAGVLAWRCRASGSSVIKTEFPML